MAPECTSSRKVWKHSSLCWQPPQGQITCSSVCFQKWNHLAPSIFRSLFSALPHLSAYLQPPWTTHCSKEAQLVGSFCPSFALLLAALPLYHFVQNRNLPILQDSTVAVSGSKLGCTLGAPELWWTHGPLGSRYNSELLSSAACPAAGFLLLQCLMNTSFLGRLSGHILFWTFS